ncbi:MAG: hypothetical protein ABIH82_02945 [Candidatus Woesearchaeota archaeon]
MDETSLIKAQCRVCNRYVPAGDFKLSFQYKTMVCPVCFSGKTAANQHKVEQKKVEEVRKPAGWDEVDEYLNKANRLKYQEKSVFDKINGSLLLKYNCPNCKYVCKYDPIKKIPSSCPYCNVEIKHKKSF